MTNYRQEAIEATAYDEKTGETENQRSMRYFSDYSDRVNMFKQHMLTETNPKIRELWEEQLARAEYMRDHYAELIKL